MILPRDLLRRWGAALAEHTAFIDGDRRRTWGDMDRRAVRLAAALQGLGIGKGDVCAVLAHDRVESVVVHRVAAALDHPEVSAELLRITYEQALAADPGIAGPGNLSGDDLAAVAGPESFELRHAALSAEEAQAWADAQWVKS